MKIFFTIVVSLGLAGSTWAMQLEAKIWAGLEKTDVGALSKNLDDHIGRLVEVRCDFRGKDIRHLKPAWYEGSVWQGGGEQRFTNVRVMVAKADLPAFKSLPTSGGGGGITLYGKVLRDSEAHFAFVRLIGRKVALDEKGRANVTW